MIRRLQNRPPIGRRVLSMVLPLVLLAGTGCQERISPSAEIPGVGIPKVQHPLVERDFPAIRKGRVLRMISSYNSSGYFIHKGGQAGFDFELMQTFARSRGLTLQVIVPDPGEDMISLLNEGKGDVVAGGILQNEILDAWAASTRPINFVHKVVVWRKSLDRPAGTEGLTGLQVVIPWDDPFRPGLRRFKHDSGLNFFITLGPPDQQAEDLLTRVSSGEIQAVVVNDVLARAAMVYLPDLELGPVLTDRLPTVWLVRQNSPELKAALNAFLKKHIRMGADGNLHRSQTYGVIYDRYFSNPRSIRRLRAPEHRPEKSGRISAYDELIRKEAAPVGLDWRMVAALIYQESRFVPSARSQADARGLMQVLPRFAGVGADSLFDVDTNLKAGLGLLNTIYNRYSYLDSLDRWRFTLAEYHAGHGHLTDARRIAMDLGRNPNQWRGSLVETLPLLMQRKYYQETRYGYYRGGETVAYVEEILNRYRMYRRLVPLAGQPPPAEAASDSTGARG